MTESTARVCTWTRSRRAAVPTDTDPVDEDTCCICLEAIDDAKQVVLRCAHKFHGQCLCDHLVHDRRCPICRDSPYEDNFYESDDDDMSIDESPISFSEAMQKARDARLQRSSIAAPRQLSASSHALADQEALVAVLQRVVEPLG